VAQLVVCDLRTGSFQHSGPSFFIMNNGVAAAARSTYAPEPITLAVTPMARDTKSIAQWPVEFDEGLIKTMKLNGVYSAQDLVLLQDVQVMQLLSVGVLGARDILAHAYRLLQPKPKTARSLLAEFRKEKNRMRTPLAALTQALGGLGFGPMLFEVAGPAGAGKSQFALSCAATLLSSAASGEDKDHFYAAIIDTEGAFSAPRLKQLIAGRMDESLGLDSVEVAAALQRAHGPGSHTGGPSGHHHRQQMQQPAAASPPAALYDDDSLLASGSYASGVVAEPSTATKTPSAAATKGGISPALLDRRQRLIEGALSRCIVYRASTVTELIRQVEALPESRDLIVVDDCTDAEGHAGGPHETPKGPKKRVITCRLGMVVIDSVAAAARNEFDTAASSGAAEPSGAGAAGAPGRAIGPSELKPVGAAGAIGSASSSSSSFARRTEALTRLASLLKSKVCDKHGAPVIITNQITKGLPPGALEAMANLMRFSTGSSASTKGTSISDSASKAAANASFAGWAAQFLEQQLVPALGPTWSHAVSMRFFVASSTAHSGAGGSSSSAAMAMGGAGGKAGGKAVTFTSRGALTIVKSSTAPRLTIPYVITGPLGVTDDKDEE
jgi:RecA/RadA recombinase